MKLESAIFYSNDIKNISTFYKEVLGFKIDFINDERFASFVLDNGVKLGIKKSDAEREQPGSQTIILKVEDVEKLYRGLKQKNLTFYKDLTTQDWGTNFSILDPDGNKLEFYS